MQSLFIMATLILCGTVALSQQKSDREREGLNGPVQTVMVLQGEPIHGPEGSWTEGKPEALNYQVYNMQGQRLEDHVFDSGLLVSKSIETYDNLGRNIRTAGYRDDNTIGSAIERKFNDRGDIVEDRSYDGTSSSLSTLVTTTYDEEGRKVKESSWYELNGSELSWECSFRYDEHGRMIEQTCQSKDGDVNQKWLTTIDTITSADDGEIRVRRTEEYRTAGDSLESRDIKLYDANGTLRTFQRFTTFQNHPDQEYDATGLLQSTLQQNEESEWEYEKIIYDDHRNPVTYNVAYYADYPSPEETELRFERTSITIDYDSYGNWIHRTWMNGTSDDGVIIDTPYSIEWRDITYFTE